MSKKNQPIGIFDSGLGGLSVWKAVAALLPNETLLYYADSGNCPYGEKLPTEIQRLSAQIVDFFLSQNCKMIIVACNTATAAAIDFLRTSYDIPFIGIEPAVKPAALQSKTGNIGILATKGTFEGRLFKDTKNKYAKDTKVFIQIGTGLVEVVEQNKMQTEEAFQLVKKYIEPMVAAEADYIVLGCTHYPFLNEIIKKIIPKTVKILNPAPAVARQAKAVLKAKKLLRTEKITPEYHFYTSGDKLIMEAFLAAQIPYPVILH